MTSLQSKPLVLKHYPPKGEPDQDCGNCDGRGCMGCVFREYDHDCRNDCPMCCDRNVPVNKHFSDAELVAEMYAAEIECRQLLRSGYQPHDAYNEASTFHRFATTPHYWQERPKTSIISLMTGLSADELDELGGVPNDLE